jgi:protease-4
MRRRLLALALCGALIGCGGKNKDGDGEGGGDEQEQPSDDAPSLGGLGNLSALGAMLSQRANEPGPYDELAKSKDFAADEDHVVVMELEGSVVELQSFSWFGGTGGTELRVLIERLRELAGEEHVTGLLLRWSGVDMSMATAEELRAALVELKTAGGRPRTLHCHAETAANVSYYLMTACDDIAIAPAGGVEISGPAAMPIHVKGLLDKLGVTADFVHIGDFKGGPEPLTHDRPSKQTVETLDAMLERSYATQVDAIAAARELEPAAVRKLIDRAVFTENEAREASLVDRVATFNAYRDEVVKSPWRVVKLVEQEEPSFTKIMEFIGVTPARRPFGPHVAVVYAVGNVVDGRGEGVLGARGEIASRTLSAALRALARDDAVRAVVLRIDSPGGSALASEQILHAVSELTEKKPVIVSMGDVAASGGYYIACRANRIYAQPNTLTGSIGVFGGKLVIGEALAGVGIHVYPMGKGKRALLWSMIDPWTPDERVAVRQLMESTYQTFVTHVADGRNSSYAKIHAVAQGRVWTGADAHERGLVDALGGLDAAIAEARTLAEVPDDAELEIYPPEPTLFDLVGSLGQVSMPPSMRAAVLTVATELGPREATVVDQLLRQLVLMRDAPIQAALLWPVATL